MRKNLFQRYLIHSKTALLPPTSRKDQSANWQYDALDAGFAGMFAINRDGSSDMPTLFYWVGWD